MKNKNGIRNLVIIGIVSIFYLTSFYLLEQREVPIHIIQGKIDNLIPFCEYFIIPYVLWFFYVGFTGVYFAWFQPDQDEYRRLSISLLTGMIVFLVISYIYPNGHLLRPELNGDNIFERMVILLYQSDTSTNILPSLHVFYSVVCCIALVNNIEIVKRKYLKWFIYILSISIVLATMFLKQHSIIDVVMALLMNGICYHLFYQKQSADAYNFNVKMKHKKKGVSL